MSIQCNIIHIIFNTVKYFTGAHDPLISKLKSPLQRLNFEPLLKHIHLLFYKWLLAPCSQNLSLSLKTKLIYFCEHVALFKTLACILTVTTVWIVAITRIISSFDIVTTWKLSIIVLKITNVGTHIVIIQRSSRSVVTISSCIGIVILCNTAAGLRIAILLIDTLHIEKTNITARCIENIATESLTTNRFL